MVQDQEQLKDLVSKKKVSTKEKEKSKPKEKPLTKVIIRRLPPTMSEETFLDQISPLPDNDYFYYVKGEHHVGIPTFSRAYINFIHQEDIFYFQERFDGYVFLDQTGTEYPAIVEFAPFQKIPRVLESGAKEDKCNTLDNDSHYLEFLKKLENPEEVILPSAEIYLEQLEQKEREMKANGTSKIVTPLVEYIQQRRMDREKYREEKKEERRRKEIEKKKLRDLERLKKRDAKKDEKKQEKSLNKLKKEEEKPPTSIKVLKNTEREQLEKIEKNESSSGQTIKKAKEVLKPKQERSKEKLNKEKSKSKSSFAPSEKTAIAECVEEAKGESSQTSPKLKALHNVDKYASKDAATDHLITISEGADRESEIKEEIEKNTDKEKKIRNKDRPAIQIYRPGAKRLSAMKEKDESSSQTAPAKREVKSRTFSRTSNKDAV